MARRVALLGATLIVAGLLVAGVQTGGFDQVDADRGVSVQVASPETAYLSVEATYSGGPVTDCLFDTWFGCFLTNEPETLTLENRYAEDYTRVQVEITEVKETSAGSGGATTETFQITTRQPFQLPTNQSQTVEIGCSDSSEGTGEATITLATDADSANASIDGVTTTVDAVQYDCTG